MKTLRMLLVAVVSALALTGCLMPRQGVVLLQEGRIIVEDAELAAYLRVERSAVTVTPEGNLHVQVDVMNLDSQELSCQYRYQWLGKGGMLLTHAPSPWRTKVLHVGERTVLDAVAPIPGAEDYRVSIRWDKEGMR